MMNTPKISIVIPSYNKIAFIKETLHSIVSQNYDNYEVIVQDGGSTDGTLEIIKEFAKKYPKKFQYVSRKDGGQLDAINKGMKKASGDILTYINADDVYAKDAFKKVAKVYTKNPSALWFAGRSIVIDGSGKEIAKPVTAYKNLLLSLNTYYLLLTTNYLMQPSVFITKEAYKKYGPFTGNKKFVLEYDLWLKLGSVKMPIVVDTVLSHFRFEPGTISATQSQYLLECDMETVKNYTDNNLFLGLHHLHNTVRLQVANFLK